MHINFSYSWTSGYCFRWVVKFNGKSCLSYTIGWQDSISNSFAYCFCILDFCQNSQKQLSNSFAYWFCIFRNLVNFRGGLTFMQVCPRLDKHRSAATPTRDRNSHARSENTDHGSSKMDQRSWLSGHWQRRSWTICRSLGELALLVDLQALLLNDRP